MAADRVDSREREAAYVRDSHKSKLRQFIIVCFVSAWIGSRCSLSLPDGTERLICYSVAQAVVSYRLEWLYRG